MRLLPAIMVAAFSGYIAISYEIIWLRTFSFAMESKADSFGLLLGAYLGGLAIGAHGAGLICRSIAKTRVLMLLVGLLLAANTAAFLVVPGMMACAEFCQNERNMDLVLVAVATALLGMALPVTAHAAVAPDKGAGRGISFIYCGNILGSVSGGLITGFWLFDVLNLTQNAFLLTLSGLVATSLIVLTAQLSLTRRIQGLCGLAALAVLLAIATPELYAHAYSHLHYGNDYQRWGPLRSVIESKSGVVALSRHGAIYSGGGYEGKFNVDPMPGKDRNRITRAFLTAAFHPDPKDILFIGLGSGSWAQVLAHHPDAARITIVEINPGFVRLAAKQPVVAGLLENSKVEIIIDDGRRFLRRTDRRFDLIVQNTIVFWRAHATNLLSREFLALTRSRLRPDGRLFINTTRSALAQKTVGAVFPHSMRYENMVIAGNGPIVIDRARWRGKLLQWRINGKAVVPEHLRGVDLFNLLIKPTWREEPRWETGARMAARTRDLPVITDDNMVTEFRPKVAFPATETKPSR